MKKCLVAILALGITLSLAGCKLEHNSKVKYAQLTAEVTTIETQAKVEVPACAKYDDKSKPTDELVKANDIMAKLFPGSEFEGCKHENINSMATYSIPMEVGTIPPSKNDPEVKGLAVIRNANGETFFMISKTIRNQIVEARKNPLAKNMALSITIRLSNNTDKPLVFQPNAFFANGIACAGLPRWNQNVSVPPSQSVNLKLSDVASEYAIANGAVPIFTEIKEQAK